MGKVKRMFVVSIVILLFIPIGCGNSVDDGYKAMKAGNFQKARGIFQKLAKKGNVLAQYTLSHMFKTGQGGEKSQVKAFVWMQRCVKDGGIGGLAMHGLAVYYINGTGTPKNLDKAIELLRRSMKKKFSPAYVLMAYLYLNGLGVPKDPAMAFSLWKAAAAMGDGEAQLKLGLAYSGGIGTPKNLYLSYMWLSAAARSGWKGKALAARNKVEAKMKPEEAGAARSIVQKW